MRLNKRACPALCSIALVVSPALGSATEIDASSFRCLTKMTPVRQFYVDNLLGDVAATLAAAHSAPSATYPPGSVVQFIPGEAMVKHDPGFNAQTKDWEFFLLGPSKNGTRIKERGTVNVANPLGTCLGCHAQAAPQWDLVCETAHGCPPLPITSAMIGALQRTDPRCGNPISAEDAEALKQLDALLKARK
jgi:hypothetical protein